MMRKRQKISVLISLYFLVLFFLLISFALFFKKYYWIYFSVAVITTIIGIFILKKRKLI